MSPHEAPPLEGKVLQKTEIKRGAFIFPEKSYPDGRYKVLRQFDSGKQGEIWLLRDCKFSDNGSPVEDIIERIRVAQGQNSQEAQQNSPDPLLEMTATTIKDGGLRVLKVSRPNGSPLATTLKKEAQKTGQLEHPYIVKVYDLISQPEGDYFIMEYMNGESIFAKQMQFRDVLKMADHISQAIDYAAEQGVIHRDIKPANILYDADGDFYRLTDFGIATTVYKLKDNATIGTPHFMSPEQFQKPLQLDVRSEVYCLAKVIYLKLTNQHLILASEVRDILMQELSYGYRELDKVITEEAEPQSKQHKNVKKAGRLKHQLMATHGLTESQADRIDAVFARALRKKPGERYQNCQEFVDALVSAAEEDSAVH